MNLLCSAPCVGGGGGAPQRRERPGGGAAAHIRRGSPGVGRPRRLRQAVGAAPGAAAPGAGHRAALQRWGHVVSMERSGYIDSEVSAEAVSTRGDRAVWPSCCWRSACACFRGVTSWVLPGGPEGCEHIDCRARLLCGCAAAPPPRGHRCGIGAHALFCCFGSAAQHCVYMFRRHWGQ
jgi:hypothetical protein